MIELHLIGYTSDLRYLVLDVEEDGGRARYRVPVDPDLLVTLDEIRESRREQGFDDPLPPTSLRPETGGARVRVTADDEPLFGGSTDAPVPEEPPEPQHEEGTEETGATPDADGSEAEETPEVVPEEPDEPEPVEPEPEEPDEPDEPDEPEPDEDGAADEQPTSDGRVESALSPAEIQSLLRAGRTPKTVAERAGTEVAWIERWLPPILDERRQVLERAQAMRLERPRLGESREPLGRAVTSNLRSKGVDLDEVRWSTKRRADGTWSVSVRYRSMGRWRTASWRLDRDEGQLSAASPLARDLGFARSRRRKR